MHSFPTKYSLGNRRQNLRSTAPHFCFLFINLAHSGTLSGVYEKAFEANQCCHHNTKVAPCLAELGQC